MHSEDKQSWPTSRYPWERTPWWHPMRWLFGCTWRRMIFERSVYDNELYHYASARYMARIVLAEKFSR